MSGVVSVQLDALAESIVPCTGMGNGGEGMQTRGILTSKSYCRYGCAVDDLTSQKVVVLPSLHAGAPWKHVEAHVLG
jgi:hypothetical protein